MAQARPDREEVGGSAVKWGHARWGEAFDLIVGSFTVLPQSSAVGAWETKGGKCEQGRKQEAVGQAGAVALKGSWPGAAVCTGLYLLSRKVMFSPPFSRRLANPDS